jgi:NAD(P)-dependent dehydrogenase (short-subunit alcohol dehydrogenase family)
MSTWTNVRYDYKGAAVLVTGGTSGIGAGIAAAYRAAGAEVTITGTRAAAKEYEGDLSGYRYLQLSLTDKAQIASVAAQLPRLDVLVNNAGANFRPAGESCERLSHVAGPQAQARRQRAARRRQHHRHRFPDLVLRA